MFLRTKPANAKKWIERRSPTERRSGVDRRDLYRFDAVGADRRVGRLRRTSEWYGHWVQGEK